MVVKLDSEKLQRGRELSSELPIRIAGLRIAPGVIVREDKPPGT
jgi:hypothetical protein